jgi:Ca2+/Na+ antiporter
MIIFRIAKIEIVDESKLQLEEDEENKLIVTSTGSILSNTDNKINKTIIYVLDRVLPNINRHPITSFIVMMVYTYFQTKIIFVIISNISDKTHIAATFLGMTLICWGGTVGDTMNAAVAVKMKSPDLLITSIIGSQVINLQLCLGIPWTFAMIRKFIYAGESLNLEFEKNILDFILPAAIVVLLSMLIFTVYDVKLNRRCGILLSLAYVGYLIAEFKINN